MGNRTALSAAVPLKTARKEMSADKYLPFARHVSESVIMLDSGDLMLTYELQGRPFETSDVRDLNDWLTKLNAMLKSLHDERLALWSHLIRMPIRPSAATGFKSDFATKLDADYHTRISKEHMFINRFFVTLVFRPGAIATDKLLQFFKAKADRTSFAVDPDSLKILEDKASDFEKLMARCAPRLCTTYAHKGLIFSEPLEVLQAVLTGSQSRVPLVRGHLGSALYSTRAIFGSETVEIRGADRSRYGGIFGIRTYPAQTTPCQFEALLSVDFAFVLSQSFTFLGRAAASEKFRLRQAQMQSAGDKAISQADDLIDAADDLMGNVLVVGEHHFSLAVYADNLKRLRDDLSVARSVLVDTGMVAAREDIALEAAYWSQLPGNFAWRARPSPITSLNFAAFSPFHTYPPGKAHDNHWGDAIALLKTTSRSPYHFNFHKGDLGHTLILGPSGGGKTVLLNFLMAQAEKTGARQIFIDKDRGAQIFILASGGTYLRLQNGQPTGFAPFKALTNSAQDRVFLGKFVRQLVRFDGKPLTVQDERQIDDGITQLMALPPASRSLAALRPMLGVRDSGGIGARLEKWAQGGSMAWVFDNQSDDLALDARFIGFDMTDFLDNPDVRAPIMMYIFHRIDALLGGERMIICIDEFWKALGDDAFRRFAQDGLKTYRKRNALMVFATQSPADALGSDIAATIIEQVATKILLPNPNGARADYMGGLGLSAAEFKLVREDLSPESHRFLVKQGHDSVVVALDLAGMDEALATLSGRAETTAIVDALIARHGSDPSVWLPKFYAHSRVS